MSEVSNLEAYELFYDNLNDMNFDFDNACTPPDNFLIDNDTPETLDGIFKTEFTESSPSMYTSLPSDDYNQLGNKSNKDFHKYSIEDTHNIWNTSEDIFSMNDNRLNTYDNESNKYGGLSTYGMGMSTYDELSTSDSTINTIDNRLNTHNNVLNKYELRKRKQKKNCNKPKATIENNLLTGGDVYIYDEPLSEAAGFSEKFDYGVDYNATSDLSNVTSYQSNVTAAYDLDDISRSYDENYSPAVDASSANTSYQSPNYEYGDSEITDQNKKKVSLAGWTSQEKNVRAKNLNNEASRKYRKKRVETYKDKELLLVELEKENSLLRQEMSQKIALKTDCQRMLDLCKNLQNL